MGTLVVSAILAVMFFLAIRSIYKSKKAGGCCGCSGCSGHCGSGSACNCATMPQTQDTDGNASAKSGYQHN